MSLTCESSPHRRGTEYAETTQRRRKSLRNLCALRASAVNECCKMTRLVSYKPLARGKPIHTERKTSKQTHRTLCLRRSLIAAYNYSL